MTQRMARFLVLLLPLVALPAFSQSDPGVRGGPAGAGGPLSSVAAKSPVTILTFSTASRPRFQ